MPKVKTKEKGCQPAQGGDGESDEKIRLHNIYGLIKQAEEDVAAAQERLSLSIDAEHAAMLVGDAADETAAVDANRRTLEAAEKILSVRQSAASELQGRVLESARQDLHKFHLNLIKAKHEAEKPLFEAMLGCLKRFPEIAADMNQQGHAAAMAARIAVFGEDGADSQKAHMQLRDRPICETVIMPNLLIGLQSMFDRIYGDEDSGNSAAE